MSNVFAPRSYEAFEDEFDLDAEFAPHPGDMPGAAEAREPLQFTAPAGLSPTGAPMAAPMAASPMAPAAPVPVSGQMPVAASGFNPVGDLMAGAASALSPSSMAAEVSVPRIAIHVFAERQDTLAAAERAGQDRRLSRATTQIRVGGVPPRSRPISTSRRRR
jgi:pilus assembly protein CpaE